MNIGNFDLNLLRAFDTLMRERNVSRAAERMALSQPAMSNTLNRLRTLLDDPVLVRTSRGMQPTPRATELEKPIRQALAMIEQSLDPKPQFDPATANHTFHLATTDYAQLLFLQKLVEHLKATAPNIKLAVHELGPDIPTAELEEGEFDFALGRFAHVPAQLRSQWWRSDELVCLVNRDVTAYGETIDIEQFLTCPQIWVSGGQRSGIVDKWLSDHGRTRNVALTTPNFLMAPIIIAQSDFLVVTPRKVAEVYLNRLPLKILPLPMPLDSFDLHLLWHPFHAGTAAHDWFRQQLAGLTI